MKRRTWLLAPLAVAGALAVGWGVMPPRQRLQPGRPRAAAAGEAVFNGWVSVHRDGRVSVVLPRSEMGQGVHTGLAQLLAEELDADWARVEVLDAPIDPIYFNQATVVDGLPFRPDDDGRLRRTAAWLTAKVMREIGVQMTGGSSSVKDLWGPLRQAGATARAQLVAAAAEAWGVPAAEITTEAGVLAHSSGRRAGYGEFAEAAARRPLPSEVALKPPERWRLIGRPQPRLDSADKSRGATRFALDVREPGQWAASVTMCPTLGGQVKSFDAKKALQRPGVKQVLTVNAGYGGTAGVAVVAEHTWTAMQALGDLSIEWDEDPARVPAAAESSAALLDRCAAQLDGEGIHGGFAFHREGDVEAALAASPRRVQAEYRAPFLAHQTLEPQNCTVWFRDGQATVWAPTQVPDLARSAVAQVLGLAADRVEVKVMPLGGGFGRRLDVDFIAQAAAIARAVPGRPVQTVWRREEDTRHDFFRPALVARCTAGLNAQGQLQAWRAVSAGPAILPQVLSRLFGIPASMGGPDKTTTEGAHDQPYAWPAARVAHHTVPSAIPVGFWRSVGHSHQAFVKECFTDEVAAAAGQDPLAFRLALLKHHPRAARVLQTAANRARWGETPAAAPDGAPVAQGLALHESFGSLVAQVAEVSIGPGAQGPKSIRVHRVVCAIDCGTPVNPNLIRQQMEGGIVFAVSAALLGEIAIERGRVAASNFHDAPLLRLADAPAVEVDIVPSALPPEGVGEPGVPPLAPAVANAVARLTGQRLRQLPLRLPA